MRPAGPRRRADIVFRQRLPVFVDGCFWQGCPQHSRPTRRNSAWWDEKIRRNRRRDRETDQRLTLAGWHIIRAWEHEDPGEVATRVMAAVKALRSAN